MNEGTQPANEASQAVKAPDQQGSEANQGNPVVLESKQDGIATLTLNRPDKLNAINKDLAVALNEALGRLTTDKSIYVVVITGAGRAFCAGGDLGVIGEGRKHNDTSELEPLLRAGMHAVLKMRSMAQPVIASVHGAAAGAGMNIALGADIRIASEDACFGQNFIKVGLFPDLGGTYFLPQLVGPAKAAEMFYTGDMIDAKEALRLGIVNRVVPNDQLEAETKKFAQKIAESPSVSIRAMKNALYGSRKIELEKALDEEVEQQLKCFKSPECREGINAFLEKRPPKFHNK
jgi:2-(1,2-epoxy-1,2-dihydrophenyl)acetyl-CoA isomerase